MICGGHRLIIKAGQRFYHILKDFTAIYMQFCFKWYIIQYGKIHGLGAFGTKLFIWYGLTPAWTYFNARPGYTAKTPMGNEKWRLLCFKRLYCNLHVILLQMIYNSIWLDTWSQSLLIQNFPYGMGADACLGILWYLMVQPGCTLKPVWGRKSDRYCKSNYFTAIYR